MTNLFRTIAIAIFVLSAHISMAAQTPSSLVVSVSDQIGNIITAADVNLIIDDKVKKITKTNNNGTAEFRGLGNEKYLISITVDGFKEYRSDTITLKPGEIRRLEVVLELAIVESTVDVDQNDSLEMSNSGVRNLEQEQIETLPDDPEELIRVLQSLAGPTLTGENMPITVNGIPGAALPTKENIKLVRINRNVFSAEYEYSYGGGIQIFTNSNVKKITGWIGANFSDARLNATNPFIGRRVPYQSRGINYGFSVPLGQKASVLFNSSYSDSETSSVVNAVVLDQNFNPVDFRKSYETPRFSSYNYAILNWDPNKKHKFVGQLTFFYGKSDSDHSGFALESRANKNNYKNISLAFTETYIINPDFVNATRFSGRIDTNETRASSSETAINVTEAFLGGGSQTDQSRTNYAFEIYNDTTKKIGRLNAGFGVMIRGYRIDEISRSNFGGTYTFSGRTAPVLDANNQPVTDGNGNIVTTQITSIESYRRTILLRSLGFTATQIRTLGGGADQFTISGGQPELNINQFDYSIYQQNNFSLNETMGVSFGLRYENQSNIENHTNFAPRFGFTWAPKAKEKQRPETTLPRITIGYGIFYNRFGINYGLSELQANATDRAFYFITDAATLDRFPVAPSVSELQQSASLRSLRLIDDDIQTPVQNIFSLNLTKSLWRGMSLNAGYTRTHDSRSILTRNINAPLAAAPGSIAPPIYPFGNSRNTYETRSEGRSRIERLFVSIAPPQLKFLGKPVYMNLWYSYAKVRNDIVAGSSSPLDPYDYSREWAPAPSDGVHQLNGYLNLTLPKMFYLRGDFNMRTGSRFNIITGRDTNRDGIYTERPAFASDVNKPGLIQTPYGLLDPNPAPGDQLIPRNLGRGPGGVEFNFYLSKTFGFNKDKANKDTPRQRFNFGVSINNAFNINNKGNPIGNMSSPNFLQTVSSSNFDGEFRPGLPRRLSFNTSFSF